MKKVLAMTTILAATASYAYAQEQLTDMDQIDDQIEKVEDQVKDDFDKSDDDHRYENTSYQEGWKGSVSLSGAANSFTANTKGTELTDEEQNFSIGARLTNGAGPWEQSLGIVYSYQHKNDEDPSESLRSAYELSRNFSDRLYGFTNITANRSTNSDFDFDGFASLGLGYRLVNSRDFAWRLQAGPGYRYALGNDELESSGAGVVLGSRLFYRISDAASLTNDTEYQWSEDIQSWSNDFGINFKVSDNLSTRLGYVANGKTVEEAEYDSMESNVTISAVLSF